MKGIALEYVMKVFLLVVIIIVVIGIVVHFYRQFKTPSIDFPADVSYLCSQLDDTNISFQDFKDVLYGFLTGQCDDFHARTKERITIDDVETVVKAVDRSIPVVKIDSCKLPEVNSHTVYLNFTEVGKYENIYLGKRKIMNSDVLICG